MRRRRRGEARARPTRRRTLPRGCWTRARCWTRRAPRTTATAPRHSSVRPGASARNPSLGRRTTPETRLPFRRPPWRRRPPSRASSRRDGPAARSSVAAIQRGDKTTHGSHSSLCPTTPRPSRITASPSARTRGRRRRESAHPLWPTQAQTPSPRRSHRASPWF